MFEFFFVHISFGTPTYLICHLVLRKLCESVVLLTLTGKSDVILVGQVVPLLNSDSSITV